jgi:hypothetical protein
VAGQGAAPQPARAAAAAIRAKQPACPIRNTRKEGIGVMTEVQTGDAAYQPMRNDPAGFDPAGGPWAYVSDDRPPQRWRALVAVAARRGTWPFAARDTDNRYFYARLSPDWCHCSWGSEYVGAEWDPARSSAVTARLSITRRPLGWTLKVTLDLAAGTYSWDPAGAAGMPDDAVAEAEVKCGKLLTFFAQACEHWRAGDQPHPPTASDLDLAGPGTAAGRP